MNLQFQNISIRYAEKKDAVIILDLIKELALFEKASNEVTNTVQDIERDGFGEKPCFGCLLAEYNMEVIGMSLYYIRYSTWNGRILYLEDIIVREKFRKNNIGRLLMESTLKEAQKLGVNGTRWQVLEWNEPAIEFYKKYNCSFDNGWINCNMKNEEFKKAILGL